MTRRRPRSTLFPYTTLFRSGPLAAYPAPRARHPASGMSVEAVGRPRGLQRLRTLWRLFRREKEDPAPFYSLLAAETAEALDREYGPLRNRRIVDLGCGPGFYTQALRDVGAEVIPVDRDPDEMR